MRDAAALSYGRLLCGGCSDGHLPLCDGGKTGREPTSDVYRLDLSTRSKWVKGSPMAKKRASHVCVAHSSGHLFVIGGEEGDGKTTTTTMEVVLLPCSFLYPPESVLSRSMTPRPTLGRSRRPQDHRPAPIATVHPLN